MTPTFYWLIDDALAGCSRPGEPEKRRAHARRDEQDERDEFDGADPRDALDRDLAWLRRQGIGAVLSLTETPLAEDVMARHDLATLHLSVPDLTAPTTEQLMRALSFIDLHRARGRAVAVHCLVGEGRTGTVLAAYRIRGGATPDQALRELRGHRPGAVGSKEQERALRAFAARRDWIV